MPALQDAGVWNQMTLLRYAGSKKQLAPIISEMIGAPALYVEPFLGAAHVALALPEGTLMRLSDLNPHVVGFWTAVKNWPGDVHTHILGLVDVPYKQLRDEVNKGAGSSPLSAAVFCALQARCFNGVWRVNRHGQNNVPEGMNTPVYPTMGELWRAAAQLRNARIQYRCWQDALADVPANATVYADPPYLGAFSQYTPSKFDLKQHTDLSQHLRELGARGVRVLVSNSIEAAPLYEGFKRHTLYPTRSVGGVRGAKAEALWTMNF